MVGWNRGPNALFNEIALWMGDGYMSMGSYPESLLRIGGSLFDYTGRLYGFVTRYDAEEGRFLRERLVEGMPGIFWAQFLGPLYVDFFGAERVENAPCFSKKSLPQGGMLLQMAQMPTGQDVSAARESEKMLRDYLDHDAFFDISERTSWFRRRRHIRKNTPVFDFGEVRAGAKSRRASL
jgi:hypothetical protein